MIALMFGVSDRTISNYRKDLECEKLMAAFTTGQRVEVIAKSYEGVDVIYRRGTVSHKDRYKLWIKGDFDDRSLSGGFPPGDVMPTDEPKAEVEIAEEFAPGDKIKHWKTGTIGIVAATDWSNKDWIWSFNTVSPANPVVLFDGKLEVCNARQFDLVGTNEPPTVEECLLVTRHQLATIGEDNAYDKRKLEGRLAFLEALMNPEPMKTEPAATDAPAQSAEPTPAVKSVTAEMGTTPAPAPTPTELKTFTNAKAEVEAKGKQLGLNGNGKQQLPTVEHEEDPVVTGRVSPAAVATTARKASLVTEILEILEEAAPDQDEALEILKRLKKYLPQDWKEML